MKAAAASEHEQGRRRARPPSQQHPEGGEVSRGMNGASSSSQAAHAVQAPGQAAPLLAIIYSEFDNTLGPTIRCQAPEGYVCLACVSLRVSFAPSRLLSCFPSHLPTNTQLPVPRVLRQHFRLRHHGPAALRTHHRRDGLRLASGGLPAVHRE